MEQTCFLVYNISMENKCLQCNKEFKKKVNTSGKYCSYKCYWASLVNKVPWNKGKKGLQVSWNKGKKCPKISLQRMGNKNPMFGKPAWNKGIHYSQITGEKHHNWKGGISSENRKIRTSLEIKLWRKACMERDDFTDQNTGIKGGYLVVHHINNFADFPELRTSISNGITLSKKSHLDFHNRYGRHNNSREQLIEFLNK